MDITKSDFQKEVLDAPVPVLVDFWAPWCGPCRMQAPILEQAKKELGDTAKIVKINIDNEQDLARKYNIMSIPTMLIFKNGEILKNKVGVCQKSEILEMLNI